MSRRAPWLTLVLSWLITGVFFLVPNFRDGLLDNATPVLLLYLEALLEPFYRVEPYLPWLALHLALTVAVTVVVEVVRRRMTPAHFARAGAVVAGLLVGAAGWSIHEFWPTGVFFDASTIYYDVGDLVGSRADAPVRFPSAGDVAAAAYGDSETRSEYRFPYYIGSPTDTQTFIAWGTWPEHYRLRKALEALRAE